MGITLFALFFVAFAFSPPYHAIADCCGGLFILLMIFCKILLWIKLKAFSTLHVVDKGLW